MLDKNGVEIQVGDKVKHKYDGEGKVTYVDYACYKFTPECDGMSYTNDVSENVEVIGRLVKSIHEIKNELQDKLQSLISESTKQANELGFELQVDVEMFYARFLGDLGSHQYPVVTVKAITN